MTDYLVKLPATIFLLVEADTEEAALAKASSTAWDFEEITLTKNEPAVRFDGLKTHDEDAEIERDD